MRSVSVRLADLENIKINLGYVGENEHVHILFDCKKAFDQYPNAVPSMVVVPPKGDAYPAVVTREGDIVEWVVTDSDLIYHGNGKIQLQFEQNDVVMKSAEARTFIAPSSIPTGTIPTPIQNWIAQANAILAEIPEDINSALAAAKASGEFDGDDGVGIASIAKTGTSGLVDTYTITLTDGSHYDIDVTNGTPGQNGVGIQNIAKTSTVGLIDTYTITLTNGQTYPFTVTNGQNGVEIDDTTPAVNKVFSSSKVDEELTGVKTAIQGLETPVQNSSGFIDANDFAGNSGVKINTLEVPYVGTDMLDESSIISNGTISTGSTYNKKMVSPLIPITGGTYGLKVVHGNYNLGNIDEANDYDNGFGFFASDGTTVVARPSHLTALGNDIYVIPVPSGAAYIRFTIVKSGTSQSYFNWALEYFNQWILLPGANTSITDDFFVLGDPKPNGEIEKIRRSDGSYLEIKDKTARNFKQVDLDSIVKVSDFLYTGQGYNVAGNNIGDLYTSGRTNNDSCSCQVITVEENTTYYIYGISNPNSFCVYTALDKDGYILQIDKSSSNYRTNPKVITPPSNAAYLIINYWGYDATKDFTKKLTKKNVEDISKKVYTPLDGKTILLLGDSILGNDRYCGVAQYLNFYTGATVINGAIGGTRLCGTTRGVSDYTPFDGENLVTAITTGVWTDQDASAGNVAGYVASQTLPALKAMDLDDVDIVIFNWMSNDLTSDTSAATFKTAFRNVVEMLLTANPNLRLLCATVEWFWTNDGGSDITTWTIGDGYDAADCSIEAAGAMHVPVIDMYRNSPISNLTKGVYLDSDKIHLNVEGNKLYAKLLSEKLRAMLI